MYIKKYFDEMNKGFSDIYIYGEMIIQQEQCGIFFKKYISKRTMFPLQLESKPFCTSVLYNNPYNYTVDVAHMLKCAINFSN